MLVVLEVLEVLEVFEVMLVMSSPDQESRTRCKLLLAATNVGGLILFHLCHKI